MRRTTCTALNRGFTLIEVIISLAILSVVFVGIMQAVAIYRDYAKGKAIATAFRPYYQAAIDYTHRYRVPLTSGGTVAGVANALAPTVAELKGLNVLGAAYTGDVPEVTGVPTFELTLIPAACSGAACDIGMAVNYPGAVMSGAFPAYRTLNFAAREFGNDAGYSTTAAPGTISSLNWSRANPLGNTEGVFGTYLTYSASGLAQFLVIGDTRDPNFAGNETVAGNIVANGTIEARGASGDARVQLAGDGSVTSYTSSGTTGAGIRYSGTVSTVFTDNLQNNSNSGGITASGSVYGTTATFSGLATLGSGAVVTGTVTLVTTQTEGSACGGAGQFARTADGQLLACIANVWRVAGITRAAEGGACTDGIALDTATPSRTLFCRGGIYVSLNSALGRMAWLDYLTVTDGSVVAAPSCGPGATPLINLVPSQFQTPAAGGTVRYAYSGSGPWTVSITGTTGAEAIAWRGCQYTNL